MDSTHKGFIGLGERLEVPWYSKGSISKIKKIEFINLDRDVMYANNVL